MVNIASCTDAPANANDTAHNSMMRDLYRSDSADIRDDYFSYWETPPWNLPAYVGGILDSSSKTTVGAWDTFDITPVVLDSLRTERKKVTLLLKMRDETETTSRIMFYWADYPDSILDDPTYTGSQAMVVYSPKTPITEKPAKYQAGGGITGLTIFTANGRMIASSQGRSVPTADQLLKGSPAGIYVIRYETTTGQYSKNIWHQ